jgi:hypothetical protein
VILIRGSFSIAEKKSDNGSKNSIVHLLFVSPFFKTIPVQVYTQLARIL